DQPTGARAFPSLVSLFQHRSRHEVDTAAKRAPNVLVPPHHALWFSSGTTGVEQVQVVRAAWAEVAFRTAGGQRGLVVHLCRSARVRGPVLDHQQFTQVIQSGRGSGDLFSISPLVHNSG